MKIINKRLSAFLGIISLIFLLGSCQYEQVKVHVEYVSHESQVVGIDFKTCTYLRAVSCNGNSSNNVKGEGAIEETFSSRFIYFFIYGKVDVFVTLSIDGIICAKQTINHISEEQTETVVECKPKPNP
jgi:hypothetical protein